VVEAAVVHSQVKGAILLLDEKDRGTGRGLRRANELVGKILVEELS